MKLLGNKKSKRYANPEYTCANCGVPLNGTRGKTTCTAYCRKEFQRWRDRRLKTLNQGIKIIWLSSPRMPGNTLGHIAKREFMLRQLRTIKIHLKQWIDILEDDQMAAYQKVGLKYGQEDQFIRKER